MTKCCWRKAIRTYWTVGKSKPLSLSASRVSSMTFMPYLTDRHKGNTKEISLSINSIVYKRFLITCVNILLLHVALCQSRT